MRLNRVCNNKTPRIAFFRGVDFDKPIGASDWRIALYQPEFGFDVWIMGRGRGITINLPGVHLVSFNSYNIPILSTFMMGLNYALQAIKSDIDIVVCNPGIFFSTLLIKILRPSIRVILDIRSIPVEVNGLNKFFNKLNYDFIFASHLYDAISVITIGMLNDLNQQYNFVGRVPTVVWESGFDDGVFKPCTENYGKKLFDDIDTCFIIMFHGSLSHNRGLFEVVHSLKILKDLGINDIRFVLIGTGSAKTDLIKLAEKLGVENFIIQLPTVPYNELPGIVALADIGIDPLPDHPWWRHQSSLKVFEYLAMGKPVLATDLPCHQNISEAVILMPNNSPKTIADAVIDYRSLSLEKKAGLHKAALRDAKKNTWRVRAETLAGFIQKEVLIKGNLNGL